ncbi:MAG: galactokinase family protein, partial [Bacillota bacterium]
MQTLEKLHRDIHGSQLRNKTFTPGVLTLLGTHTDYVGGATLSVTLNEGVWGASSPRVDRLIKLYFEGVDKEVFTLDLEDLDMETDKPHHTTLIGLIKKLVHEGYDVSRGMNMTIQSDMKKESDTGFSSAMGMTLIKLLVKQNDVSLKEDKIIKYLLHVQKETLGTLATRTEPINMLNKEPGTLQFINPRSDETKTVPFDFEHYTLMAFDSDRSPELSMNSIVKRMKQIDKGYEAINAKRSIDTLGDLSIDKFNQFKTFITSAIVMKRVEHVIFENDRAKQAVEVLENEDYVLFGELFTQSHTSLRELMEVSCEELDYLTHDLNTLHALGAKMTGLGFG